VARRIAHTTYRSAEELNLRFGRRPQQGEEPMGGHGRYAVESYLDHHADKLVHRFDANSYVVLTEAMNAHDVGRGRGGVAAALQRVSAQTVVAAVDSDRLYPIELNREVAVGIRGADPVRVITSPHGHDGFLVEDEAVGRIAAELLVRRPRPLTTAGSPVVVGGRGPGREAATRTVTPAGTHPAGIR
jgi:homoserine O-acetyltransferase